MADNPKTSNNQNQGQNSGQGQNDSGMQDDSRSKGGQASYEVPQNTDESQGDMTGDTTE